MSDRPESNRVTRRQFLVLGGTGLVALVAAGCGGTSGTSAPAPAPASGGAAAPTAAGGAAAPVGGGAAAPAKVSGTVEFLSWGDTSDVPAWDKLVPAYQQKNSAVTIKRTDVADPNNNFYPKLQTSIAGGTPPDVSSFQGWEWQVYADKNVLVPVDDYVKRDNFSAIYPTEYSTVDPSTRRKGKTYLVPLQLATMVMFYAKKMFDEAGVAYPKDDWTLDQFLDMAKKLTNTSGASKKFGYQTSGAWFRDIGWIVGTGKREFDSIVDPKKAMFSQPEVMKIIQTVASDVMNTLKVSPTSAESAGGANTINTGNCAMKYEGPWFFPQLNSQQLRDQKKEVLFDVVRMPKISDDKRPHRGWAEGVALVKGKNPDAAWDFVKYMAGEEGNKIYSETTGRIPNNPKLIESFWLPAIKQNFGVENGKAFVDALKNSQVDVISGVPRSKMWSEVVKPTAWDPLTAGSKKAEEVMPEVDKKLNAMLDEYWKTQ